MKNEKDKKRIAKIAGKVLVGLEDAFWLDEREVWTTSKDGFLSGRVCTIDELRELAESYIRQAREQTGSVAINGN